MKINQRTGSLCRGRRRKVSEMRDQQQRKCQPITWDEEGDLIGMTVGEARLWLNTRGYVLVIQGRNAPEHTDRKPFVVCVKNGRIDYLP